MGYKLTEDMGYTSNWAGILEKCVTDGTETAICEFGGQRSFYGDGAVPGVWSIAQDGPQMDWAARARGYEGARGAQPCAAERELPAAR